MLTDIQTDRIRSFDVSFLVYSREMRYRSRDLIKINITVPEKKLAEPTQKRVFVNGPAGTKTDGR
jgi:hypothetical protein